MLANNYAMYSINLVKIMPPEFIVLYNGKDEYPEESTLYLSDAFGDKDTGSLELKVKVYNVNKGHNQKIMLRSETLNEYSIFVKRAYDNIYDGLKLAEALEKTVKDCIKDNILREFLEKYGSDVINMLSMEFNLDDALRVRENDGIIKGKKEGIKEGIKEGKEEVAESLLREGFSNEIVIRTTKLPKEKIEKLAQKIKNEQLKS